eukprot:749838-Prorocentrum_minimum.AAC.7
MIVIVGLWWGGLYLAQAPRWGPPAPPPATACSATLVVDPDSTGCHLGRKIVNHGYPFVVLRLLTNAIEVSIDCSSHPFKEKLVKAAKTPNSSNPRQPGGRLE